MENQDLRIVRLRGENVKAIKAISRKFGEDTNSVVVQGDNAQGKSSLLDMIAFAFCGKRELPEEPLAEGAERGTIEVGTSGDVVVERTITEKDSYLTVRAKDGTEYDSPQSLLDSLRGELWADPYKFRSESARQVREHFLRLLDLDIDLEDWEERKEELYEERKRKKKKRDGLEEELAEEEIDPDIPSETISIQDLVDEISEAEELRQEKIDLEEKHNRLNDRHEEVFAEAERKRKRAERLIQEAEDLEEEAEEINEKMAGLEEEIREIEVPETESKKRDLEQLEEKNDRIREKKKYLDREKELERLQEEVNRLQLEVEALWAEKREAIESADFPVDGLTAEEGELRWNGTPLEQLSQAEKLYLYSALAIAENPALRCLLIPDASLLDDGYMDKIKDLAKENRYQIFFECVHDAEGDVKIQIREGVDVGGEEETESDENGDFVPF